MINILNIISKNIKLLLRSKSSALIIVIGPLLLIFLVGISFDNAEKFNIHVGTYSDSSSNLTKSLILNLRENNFVVSEFKSVDLCVEKIKQGTIHTCIEFPSNFSIDSETNDLIIYVDYSKINLVWVVLNTLSTEIEEKSSEVSMGLTSTLLNKMESARINILDISPAVAELESQNKKTASQLNNLKQGVLSVNVKELKEMSSKIGTDILAKVTSARTTITSVQTTLDSVLASSNASSSVKTGVQDKIGLIDTYLYNIYSILKDPNNLTESDWEKVTILAESIESDFSGIEDFINKMKSANTKDSEKINKIKTTLSSISDDISSIKITNATSIVNPINTDIRPVIAEKSYLDYLFPSLIILVIMFISILLATTLVMMEKHSPAYFRTFLTPTRNITFIISTYFTNLILVFVQVAVILIISSFFFKSEILSGLLPSLTVLFIATSLFTFIGMAIGYLFNSEETSILAAISTGSIFLFLSDVILPLESMPDYISNIAQFNPFVVAENLLRKSILFNSEFNFLTKDIITLTIYTIGLFLLIWAFHIMSRKHFYHKMTYKRKSEQNLK